MNGNLTLGRQGWGRDRLGQGGGGGAQLNRRIKDTAKLDYPQPPPPPRNCEKEVGNNATASNVIGNNMAATWLDLGLV